MKILVPIKRVIDPYVNIRVKADGSGVDDTHVKMAINPFDEIALEAALRFKEAQLASEVIVINVGGETSQETLRAGLALGADRALLLSTATKLEPLIIAKLLAVIVQQEAPQLVLLGKQSIDGDHNQTGQMLAGLLHWPQATFASHIELGSSTVKVTREIDGGLQTLKLRLPAVITTDLRLNQPRYASLPNIMKAKQKPLSVIDATSLRVDLTARQTILTTLLPPDRQPGIKVNDVAELLAKLRLVAKVIP